MRALLRMPLTGTEKTFAWERRDRWKAHDDRCGICGEYGGAVHARCWWLWLTSERVIRGAWDGEQQIEPDADYPSRWYIVWRTALTLLDPRWWKFCYQERISPWPSE